MEQGSSSGTGIGVDLKVQTASPGSCSYCCRKNASELHQLALTPLITQHQADLEYFLLQAGGGCVPEAGNIPHQPEPAGQSCPVPGSSLCHPELLPWADVQQSQRKKQTADHKTESNCLRSGTTFGPKTTSRFIPSYDNGSAWKKNELYLEKNEMIKKLDEKNCSLCSPKRAG